MLSDREGYLKRGRLISVRLNAPYGAPYFLTTNVPSTCMLSRTRLNAPYGAPRFLASESHTTHAMSGRGLNAPYGAPRFLMLLIQTFPFLAATRS